MNSRLEGPDYAHERSRRVRVSAFASLSDGTNAVVVGKVSIFGVYYTDDVEILQVLEDAPGGNGRLIDPASLSDADERALITALEGAALELDE